jgi:hypothetical protein
VYKRGPKPPPFLWEKGAPTNFKLPKILTEFSFGIGMVNTEKIPKGSYQNTESGYNSTPLSGKDHNSLTYFLSGFDVNSFLLRNVLIPKVNYISGEFAESGWRVTSRHLTQRNTQTQTHSSHLSLFCLPPFFRARNLTRVYVRLRYSKATA